MGVRELSDLNPSAAFNERDITVIAMIKSVSCSCASLSYY